MSDYEKKVAQATATFWKPLRDALGPVLDPHAFPVGLNWQAKPEDLKASQAEMRAALTEGLRDAGRWAESMPKEATEEEDKLSGSDTNWRVRQRIARRLVARQAQGAFATVAGLGALGPALEALESTQAEFGDKWDCLEICATVLRASLKGPSHGFDEPLSLSERVNRTLESKWWVSTKTDVWDTMGAGREQIVYALALVARAASFDPTLADASGLAAKKSFLLWAGEPDGAGAFDVDLVESFGKKIASYLGNEKIRGGQIPELFWNALPWNAQLGFSQELGSKSKMGGWTRKRLLSELAAGGVADQKTKGRLEEATATFWLSFDQGGIEMLEEKFPHASVQWLRSGIEKRMGQGGAVVWHHVESSWKDARAAAWARKMADKAGLSAPERGVDRMKVASSWAHLCEGLRSLREQESLALEIKETAQKREAKVQKDGLGVTPIAAKTVRIKKSAIRAKKRL